MAETTQGKGYSAPGAIQIKACTISNFDQSESHDIRYLVQEFSIYRSLFSDHIRGEVIISDALALVSRMPIVGEETINLTFVTPSATPSNSQNKEITIQGRVVSLKHQYFENIRNVFYRLEFVSQYQIVNLMRVVRVSFGPDLISNIAKKIAKDYLAIEDKKFTVEPTVEQHKCVMPAWSPFRCMRYLCQEAISATNKSGDYFFWEDVEGHYFKTLDSLLGVQLPGGIPAPGGSSPSQPAAIPALGGNDFGSSASGASGKANEYWLTEQSLIAPPGKTQQDTQIPLPTRNPTRTGGSSSTDRNNPEEWRYIHKLQMHQLFDIEVALKSGAWDNKVLWVDTLMQQYEAQKIGSDPYFNYIKHGKQNPRLASHDLISNKALHGRGFGDSHIRFLHANPNQTWQRFQVTPRKRQQKLPYGIAAIEAFNAIRFEIHVPGDTNRRLGDIITINVPEFGATDDVRKDLNKYLKGKYMVTAIRDKYTFNYGFFTTIEVVKNGYEAEIAKAPAQKSNNVPAAQTPNLPPELSEQFFKQNSGSVPENESGSGNAFDA